jgi:hypothetical protein
MATYTQEQIDAAELAGIDLTNLGIGGYEGMDYTGIPEDVSGLVSGTGLEKYEDIFAPDLSTPAGIEAYKLQLGTMFPDLADSEGRVREDLLPYLPEFPGEQYSSILDALRAKRERESGLIGEEYGLGVGELRRGLGTATSAFGSTTRDIQRRADLAQEGYLEGAKGVERQYGIAGAGIELGRSRDVASSRRKFAEGRTQLRGSLLGQAGGLRQFGAQTGFKGTGVQEGGKTALFRRSAEELAGLSGGYADQQRRIAEDAALATRGITEERRGGLRRLQLGRKESLGSLAREGTQATQRYRDLVGQTRTKSSILGLERGRKESLLQEAIESGILGARGQARSFVSGLSGTALNLARLGAEKGQGWKQHPTDSERYFNPITGEEGYWDTETGEWVLTGKKGPV